jgi:hypothetical protein
MHQNVLGDVLIIFYILGLHRFLVCYFKIKVKNMSIKVELKLKYPLLKFILVPSKQVQTHVLKFGLDLAILFLVIWLMAVTCLMKFCLLKNLSL